MAGPSIVVRVLGDLTGLAKSIVDAGAKGAAAAKGLHETFSTTLNALNQTGVLGPFGAALDGIDTALDQVAKHAKEVGPALIGAGGALAGIGVGLSAVGSADQAAHQQLQASVAATGKSYDDYSKQVDQAVKHQEKFGNTAAQTDDALRVLTQATGDPAKALGLLNTASDLAAAKHESLGTAATQVGKVYNGNTKLLKEYGIQVGKTTTATQSHSAVTQLSAKVQGQAAAASDTFGGKMRELKAKVEDTAASLGQKYGPAITAAGAGMTIFGGLVSAAPGALKALQGAAEGVQKGFKLLTGATEAMSAAEDAAAVSEGAALWPLLLIAVAVAALVAVGYLLYKNWDKIWAFIKKIIKDVWDWIKNNWPYLLGILLGPVALAAALIYKHWQDIWDGIKKVWNWLQTEWAKVYGFLKQPVEDAINWIVGAWKAVTDAVTTVINWIQQQFDNMVNWFSQLPGKIANVVSNLWHGITDGVTTAINWVGQQWDGLINTISGLPGRIANAASGMWDGITAAFRGAVNALIDIWNGLHFTLPAINFGPIHLGGETIGVPSIPHLAQGGLITGSGLVYAHAGEAITPIDAIPRGPAVVINDAHFATELDVDAFLRRAAWIVQTRGI
jgi:predicted PurR-regulated permease PerM